ncbi:MULTISPECIES: lipid-A-disaccharide synthase N-terminal domain-containing protein [Kaistia]|uniref:Lipid-A-disaccharide synthase N-terminal domain-containing protein n=1 Tax=Kaistia nematophila TaxID=2994654 RepID=A0A9X3DYZ2_9HYPH|nr:lipid-A-disaccharide synthase N-terminal domain-containing protein [Kaistia nematophila]MBN9024933.1 lipid-A-disaccharide synthase N-terminal domain-containing protein [Hyphomicrobiales bacterium]MCX5568616.1 lipid-A-disaccharide synthase N-terminal domain-containing protein [Kaistia nematophila]
MAGNLFGAIANWLHHVFVEQFDVWILLGFVAQALFTMRFVVQWIASERAKKSVVPAAFWTFSILGGALLLIYAIYRKDPVFIAGQAAGLFIYFRNVWFILHERKLTRESGAVS